MGQLEMSNVVIRDYIENGSLEANVALKIISRLYDDMIRYQIHAVDNELVMV